MRGFQLGRGRQSSWAKLPTLLLLSGLLLLPGCGTRQSSSEDTTQAADRDSRAVLKLLYSRVPTTLNPHVANGFQDFEASRIVYEPLATYQPDGRLLPVLAVLVPTPENGGVSADGRSVTWKLKPDVRWSDGRPFTAEDVVFTYELVSDPQVAAVTETYYEAIEKVEAIDPLTVKVTFKEPNPSWALPFTGQNGMILPKHVFAAVKGRNIRQAPANLQPVGTGPYRFIARANGVWTFAANEQFREGPPGFNLVELQGGVPPYVAARQVLRDNEADFAHNLQLSIEDRVALSRSGAGRVEATFGSYVERIMLNPTDPNKTTDTGERSSVENPHPFLSELKVRQAVNYAIDRDAIASEIYGNAGQLANQILPYPEKYANPSLSFPHDPAKAKALLDEAGWKDTNDNGIRDKDGVEMRVVFQTPINPVRQQTQNRVKADLKDVGIDVEISRVIVDDFFSADPNQTRSLNHFYADMQEYNAGSDTPDPAIYMSWWLCEEIANQENRWQKPNNARYCNEAYDDLWEQASKALDPEVRSQLFQRMNTILMEDVAVIPLVRRAVTNGISARIIGVDPTPWDASTWDIGTWQLADAELPEASESEALEPENTEDSPSEAVEERGEETESVQPETDSAEESADESEETTPEKTETDAPVEDAPAESAN
ncbi:MAG: peptide ABC transporter substrate-binding protein [Cyanobacteria bacterium J06554_3]